MGNCDTVISSSHTFLSRSEQHKTLINNNFSNCHGEQIKLALNNFKKYNPPFWYKQQ